MYILCTQEFLTLIFQRDTAAVGGVLVWTAGAAPGGSKGYDLVRVFLGTVGKASSNV
jgi:hypothetical protein